MDRAIIHLNVTDFAVAVERIGDSSLRHSPLIVASGIAGKSRAVVYDMSEEAYQDGVRKGMSLQQANRYCRAARIIPPRPDRYRRAMAALVKGVIHYTPLVEKGEEDGHLFLDVTGTHRLFGPAPDIAWRLRKQLAADLGLDPVWSIASSKLVAKVASRMVRPFGEYIVGAGEEHVFLAPLPLSMLPGLTAEEIKILQDFNLHRIGQLAELSRRQLLVPFRKRGSYLYEASRGRDHTAVRPVPEKGDSFSVEHIFEEDTASYTEVEAAVAMLVHGVGRSLRRRNMLGRRLKLVLVHADGKKSQRQVGRKGGSDNDFVLRNMAFGALGQVWGRRVRVRSCVLICEHLLPRSPQQALFVLKSLREEQQEKIITAMDQICSRFGDGSIVLGNACEVRV